MNSSNSAGGTNSTKNGEKSGRQVAKKKSFKNNTKSPRRKEDSVGSGLPLNHT